MLMQYIVSFLIKIDSLKNVPWNKLLIHIFYVTLLIAGIPLFYIFEICYVLPTVIEPFTITYFIHILCSTFLFINIVSNMVYAVLTKTSIKGLLLQPTFKQKDWSLCAVCETIRPPRAWHCDVCNICVLKRDHHCTFLATCIGYFNYRYFFLFTFYIFLAMVYAFYYNVYFLAKVIDWNDKWIILKFIFPLLSVSVNRGPDTVYVLVFVFNVLFGLYSGFLFFFHLDNLLSGCTTPERKIIGSNYNFALCFHRGTKDFIYNSGKGYKSNLVESLGSRWYLTWISPFINSPLPGNGIYWPTKEDTKCK